MKLFWLNLFCPHMNLSRQDLARDVGDPPIITDAKALYDAAANESAIKGLNVTQAERCRHDD